VTRKPLALLAAAVVLLLAACGEQTPSSAPVVRGPFAYDPSAPIDYREARTRRAFGATVHDISYASPRGGRVPAYLVLAPGSERHGAVILLHGSGGDRSELLDVAARLAREGVVALTIDSPFTPARRPQLPGGLPGLRRQRDLAQQEIVDLRRAVDVLGSLPQVDPARVGFYGWSAGARSGAILAGVERRIGSFVLVSGGATPVADYAALAPASIRPELVRILGSIDPLRWIAEARPRTIFFQNGRSDEIVPVRARISLIRAAPPPQRERTYAGGHIPSPREQADAVRWLAGRLKG
jgi:dienelactone hydrolase